jgi:ribonuclease HIII
MSEEEIDRCISKAIRNAAKELEKESHKQYNDMIKKQNANNLKRLLFPTSP